MEKIIIVNDKDEVIGSKERGTLIQEDIYRVSALWIINKKEEILLAKRAYSKKKDPGRWGPAVAGTIEKGETYESNIKKETEEELGLEIDKFEKGIKTRIKRPHNHFTQWFVLRVKNNLSDIKINQEVAEIKWLTKDELIELIKNNPNKVVNSMKNSLDSLP